MLSELALKSALVGASLLAPVHVKHPVEPPACAIGTERVKTFETKWGDTLGSILSEAEAGPRTAKELRRALRRYYRINRMHRGDRIDVGFSRGGVVRWFRYRPSLTAAACAVRDGRFGWNVRLLDIPIHRDLEMIELEADPSIAQAIEEAGEDPSLETRLEELFPSASIDGARILVERLSVEGEFLTYSRVHAAEVSTGGKRMRAFYFEHPDGRGGYYTQNAVPLDPLDLHNPAPTATIVSGYGWRWHPIRRRRRPHKGLDYAAPRDTVIHAAANGVVTQARYYGPLGRMVVIDHGDGLVTRYAHLNRYFSGIRPGTRVRRGQPIGRIGTSGLTTGAHLHFETLIDGRHVNPKRVGTPPPPPITDELLPAFEQHVEDLLRRMDLHLSTRDV